MGEEIRKCLGSKWYVVANDLIGGWTVVNQPGCQYLSEVEVADIREVADCWAKEIADSIAEQHNRSLED